VRNSGRGCDSRPECGGHVGEEGEESEVVACVVGDCDEAEEVPFDGGGYMGVVGIVGAEVEMGDEVVLFAGLKVPLFVGKGEGVGRLKGRRMCMGLWRGRGGLRGGVWMSLWLCNWRMVEVGL